MYMYIYMCIYIYVISGSFFYISSILQYDDLLITLVSMGKDLVCDGSSQKQATNGLQVYIYKYNIAYLICVWCFLSHHFLFEGRRAPYRDNSPNFLAKFWRFPNFPFWNPPFFTTKTILFCPFFYPVASELSSLSSPFGALVLPNKGLVRWRLPQLLELTNLPETFEKTNKHFTIQSPQHDFEPKKWWKSLKGSDFTSKKKSLQPFFFKAANHQQIPELPWLFRFFRGAWLGGGPASSKAVRAGMGGAAFGGPKLGGNGTLDAGGGQPTGRPTRRSLISITTRSPSICLRIRTICLSNAKIIIRTTWKSLDSECVTPPIRFGGSCDGGGGILTRHSRQQIHAPWKISFDVFYLAMNSIN